MWPQDQPCHSSREIFDLPEHRERQTCGQNLVHAAVVCKRKRLRLRACENGCYANQANVELGREKGVDRTLFIKRCGLGYHQMGVKKKTFDKLRDFRAGIENNISEIKRALGMSKARWKCSYPQAPLSCSAMRDLFILVAHLLTTIAKLLGPGGARAIIADSLLMKQQLLIINRHRQRAPRLTPLDRFLSGFWSLFLILRRIQQAVVIIRPSTVLKFHQWLKQRKYRLLYASARKTKPGPKGPSKEIIDAVIELKRRNPQFECPRIAQQINHAFGITIDKDVVRRILAAHYPLDTGGGGPSWLTFLAVGGRAWCLFQWQDDHADGLCGCDGRS